MLACSVQGPRSEAQPKPLVEFELEGTQIVDEERYLHLHFSHPNQGSCLGPCAP